MKPISSFPPLFNIIIMRWSLILSTSLTVLSTLSVALVIPLSESSVDLERRAGDNAKTSSKNYRKESENHDYVYKFDQTGSVSREKLKLTDRPANGRKIIMIPHTDAGKSIALNTYIYLGRSLTAFFSNCRSCLRTSDVQ